jgi:hypothetical protein
MDIKTGRFSISPNRTVAGELQIAGPQSSVLLRDDEALILGSGREPWITGSLYNQTEITLIDCIQLSATSHKVTGRVAQTHSLTLFPHFIVEGRVHLDPRKPTIRALSFTFEDAASLFYDFDAFGALIEATPYIQSITDITARKIGRPIRTGPDAHIAYFTGQRLIVETQTMIGKISAQHCPTWPVGGPKGVRIDNEIWVSITPDSPITFDDAIKRMLTLLRFITIAVGRRQTIPEFSIEASFDGMTEGLNVHWSNHPRRSPVRGGCRESPHPRDLPLDPIRHSNEFVKVLKAWLASDTGRRIARVRADDSCALQNFYPVDRLVGVANAFDLLPASAVPEHVALSSELLAAKQQCKVIFRELRESDERESLLRALGRLGHATLKQKVRHRANIISTATGDQYFQSLEYVCNQAIECRNYYVHGSPVNFDLEPPSRNFGFLTDTLEFVFGASELIESGWDIVRFLKTGTSMTHPFGAYAVTYNENLQKLRTSVKAPKAMDDDP